mmetsp:Transcript_92414/g.258258  ORF Transcript_92414/g.258258 Transcript_92414/m.258258 type:complete len:245 (-) Transcript_92414:921-1655(-)
MEPSLRARLAQHVGFPGRNRGLLVGRVHQEHLAMRVEATSSRNPCSRRKVLGARGQELGAQVAPDVHHLGGTDLDHGDGAQVKVLAHLLSLAGKIREALGAIVQIATAEVHDQRLLCGNRAVLRLGGVHPSLRQGAVHLDDFSPVADPIAEDSPGHAIQIRRRDQDLALRVRGLPSGQHLLQVPIALVRGDALVLVHHPLAERVADGHVSLQQVMRGAILPNAALAFREEVVVGESNAARRRDA